ncbi:MAG: rod shape-determining protein MreC [Jatrophihabitans sp.]
MRRLTQRQRRAGIALAIIALLFVTSDVVGASFAGARTGVRGFFGALYRGTDSVTGPARRWVQALPHIGSDAATIDKLHRQIADLQRTAAQTAQDKKTHDQLAKLQLQSTRGGYKVVPARVIAIGPSGGFDWTVTLDVGTAEGVKVDQSVIVGPALVGRILRVSATSTTVLLAADPGSGVGVRDQRTGQLGVVTGHGTSGFTFVPLDPNAVPKVGDVMISGPTGSTTYVAGLTVGTISKVDAGTDGTVRATVRPATSPTSLDLVGVVLVGGKPGGRTPLVPGGNAEGGR